MERAAIRDVLAAAGTRGDASLRRILAAILATAWTDGQGPSLARLGLTAPMLRLLFAAYFPAIRLEIAGDDTAAQPAIEEEDLRRLLLAHRAHGRPEEEWLAAIIARRAQGANHLWEDLGLDSRDDLNHLMSRYFPALSARNVANMRWKKFFYRLLCEEEGLTLCKSPSCGQCSDFAICFEPASSLQLRRAG